MLSPAESEKERELIRSKLNIIILFVLLIKTLLIVGLLIKGLIDERKNISFKGMKQFFKQGFRNMLGLRKGRLSAPHSNLVHAHPSQIKKHHHQDSIALSSDSDSDSEDSLSDSVEYKAPPQTQNQTKKKIPSRKNWGRGSIYKSGVAPINLPKTVASNIPLSKASKVYDLHNMHGSLFGRLSVNPRLIADLDETQKRVLTSLCDVGRVIEGNSQGRKGWIRLSEPKNRDDWALKGKDSGHCFRFYATKKDNSNKQVPDYSCTGFSSTKGKRASIMRYDG